LTTAYVFALSLLPVTAAFASPPVTVLHTFDPMQGQLPESITADDVGNLYLTVGGTLQKYTTDHQLITLATIPIPPGAVTLGVKVGPDGFVYVVSAGFTPSPAAAFVWRVSAAGQVSLFATLPPEGIPNDLVFDARGNLYVTDSGLGQIWKIDPSGNPQVWFADPLLLGNPASPVGVVHALGANGIAFDRFHRHLYVSNTDFGRIVRIGIQRGQAKGIEVVATSDLLRGADGIAFDVLGTLYVAVNAADQIVTVARDGAVSVLVGGAPFDAPSSLVFGTRCSDRHTLYVTNFAIQRALGVKPGTPQPSLVSLPVPFPGLDLDLP
jgi:sugar lactone lactonase YvrE